MARYTLPLSLFAALIIFFAVILKQEPSPLPSALIDKSIPSFKLSSVLNIDEIVTDKIFIGKIALLNVWATWCASCIAEHSILTKIKADYKIPIYGLNYKDDRLNAEAWLKKQGNPYLMSAFDKDGRVAIELGVYGTPETFIIDKGGIIRYRHVGPLSMEEWEKTLWPLIKSL